MLEGQKMHVCNRYDKWLENKKKTIVEAKRNRILKGNNNIKRNNNLKNKLGCGK